MLSSMIAHTNNGIELLPVVQNECIDLRVRRLVRETLRRVHIRHLLKCAVDLFLQNLNLLLLLLTDPVRFTARLVDPRQQIVDLNLLRTQGVLELLDLPIVPAEHARYLRVLRARQVLGPLVGEVELTAHTIHLVFVARLAAIDLEPRTVTLANHVSKLEVLRLDVTFHALHLVDSFLCRVGLELHLLELGKHIEVLRAQLAVQFGERLVLVAPMCYLLLQLADELVF